MSVSLLTNRELCIKKIYKKNGFPPACNDYQCIVYIERLLKKGATKKGRTKDRAKGGAKEREKIKKYKIKRTKMRKLIIVGGQK